MSSLALFLDDLHVTAENMLHAAISGTCFYFVKGVHSSSSEGCPLAGGVEAAVANAPRVCRWTAWFGVLLTIDSGMVNTRRDEAPLNMAVAWAAANALFSMRRGRHAAAREGLKGAAYGWVASIALYRILRFIDSVKRSGSSR
jgi:hypothetical protein